MVFFSRSKIFYTFNNKNKSIMKQLQHFRSRRLYGLLVAFVALLGSGGTAWADGYKYKIQSTGWSLLWPELIVDVYLAEDDGPQSYWFNYDYDPWTDVKTTVRGNVTFHIGDSDIEARDLGLAKNNSGLHDIRKYDGWYTSVNRNGGTIAIWDPHYNGAKEHWITAYMVRHHYVKGQEYSERFYGYWVNNGNSTSWVHQYLTHAENTEYDNHWPDYAGLVRANQKLTYKKQVTMHRYGYTNYFEIFTRDLGGNYVEPTQSNGLFYSGQLSVFAGDSEVLEIPVNNYTSYTLYPRQRSLKRNFTIMDQNFGDVDFTVNYGKVMIPGFPRAKGTNVEVDMWTKKCIISWSSEVHSPTNCDKNGRWYIFRRIGDDYSTTELIGDVPYSTNSFEDTDESKVYGTVYNYIVCFCPNGWNIKDERDAVGLSSSKTITLDRNYSLEINKVSGNKESIDLAWQFTAIPNASASNPYVLQLQRSTSADPGKWSTVLEQEINNSKTYLGKYTDTDCSNKCTQYSYRLVIEDLMDTTWESEVVKASISGTSKVTSLSTSRGAYAGQVRVVWTADQFGLSPTYYNLYRRPLGSERGSDWAEIYTTSGTAATYNYEDKTALPGEYYEYRVLSYAKCTSVDPETGENVTTDMDPEFQYSDGFCVARGVIGGRIYYDTGTAVPGVRVTLKPSNDSGTDAQAFYALRVSGMNDGVRWDVPESMREAKAPYTLQMFVRPILDERTDNAMLLHDGTDGLRLQLTSANKLMLNGAETDITLEPNAYTLLTVRYDGEAISLHAYDAKQQSQSFRQTAAGGIGGDKINFAWQDESAEGQFKGYIDDIRIWTRVLSDKEVVDYSDHVLAGNESGLVAYLPMDEGIKNQKTAYDYSKNSGAANGNHAAMRGEVSTVVPTEEQFGLLGFTDIDGNYVIRGIPFNGEGTNYTIIPTMGSHDFSPTTSTRFISQSSLVHSGVDFTDVSSFPVSGVVYYENTTYPVEGVTFAVDGVTCTKDGKLIETNSKGEYTISVPIGAHYITASKNGHTFVNDGRYPKNPDANSHELKIFDSPVENLAFYDNTLVTIAGRVVGGKDEGEKPLGLGQSRANIGRAKITLKPVREARMNVVRNDVTGDFVNNDQPLNYLTGTRRVNSEATVGFASQDDAMTITILTDSQTGEFSAKVPPVLYDVTGVSIPSQPSIVFSDLATIDASQLQVKTDSIEHKDGTVEKFDYVDSMVKVYEAKPVFNVTQKGAPAGLFGETSITVGKDNVPVIIETAKGKYDYATFAAGGGKTVKYPLFQMGEKYTYDIEAYEEYKNCDADTVVSRRYLKDYLVNVSNQLGSTTEVYGALGNSNDGAVANCPVDSIRLDEFGRASFRWMAGLPSISYPFTRSLTITYGETGEEYSWSGNGTHGIVLGDLPSGNNFVTEGPNKIEMILRDPPGSESKSWFEKGKTRSFGHSYASQLSSDMDINTVTHLGAKATIGSGIGVFVLSEAQALADLTVGTINNSNFSWDNDTIYTVTTTDRISTLDSHDYVGADGDVFYGRASNLIYGNCRFVGLKKAPNGTFEMQTGDAISLGQEFTTQFVYTQHEIENDIIPGLKLLRDNLLTTVQNVNSVPQPALSDGPVYATRLRKEDKDFGTQGTYTIIYPADADKANFEDKVMTYNSWIEGWKQELYNNEMAKVTAMKDKSYFDTNLSFSSGVELERTSEVTKDSIWTATRDFKQSVRLGIETGVVINSMGVTASITETLGGGFIDVTHNSETTSEAFGYLLKESGTSDKLTVDVYRSPDPFGPIFVTRGGQTSDPYEDKVVTKYYKPGTEISAKTMQIEVPKISAEQTVISGVPSGKDAVFTIYLMNESETSENCYFRLSVVEDSNEKGAVIKYNGQNLQGGTDVLCKYSERQPRTLTISQSDLSEMTYKDIRLVLASKSQNDPTGIQPVIADTISLSVTFVPAGADIDMEVSPTILNVANGNVVTLKAKNFDRNHSTLKRVKLQMRTENDSKWTTLLEHEKAALADNMNALGEIVLTYDMADRTDGTYYFRAITECEFGATQAEGVSEEIMVVKDQSLPQLIALPSPSDGILDYGDEISLTFNENIQNNRLTKADNFVVTGVTNGAELTHDVALRMNGTTAAHTDTRIDLAGRNFTIEAWLNWSEAGELLQHCSNDNNLQLAVDAEGHLKATIGGETFTSAKTIEKNQWVYLMMSLDQEMDDDGNPRASATMNVSYALDAATVNLFTAQAVPLYKGNGTLMLGKGESNEGIKGKIHELTLWNSARSKEESLSQKSQTKSRYTQGIVGYWPLDEGNGTLGEDRARNRNLIVADNAWFIDGTNYVLNFNGTNAATINVSSISTNADESYLVEGWFRVDEKPASAAHLINTSSNSLDVLVNSSGKLALAYKAAGSQADDPVITEETAATVSDGKWHHVALNVLKSTSGNATLYLDGKAMKNVSAKSVPSLQSSSLYIGHELKGAADEIRIWKGRRTANVIKNKMYARVSKDEPGLVAYFPLDTTYLDEYNQHRQRASLNDFTGHCGALKGINGSALVTNDVDCPPVKPLENLRALAFDFVASERKVLINMNEAPAAIEGRTLYFTVNAVRDARGNESESVTWSAYIQQNQLKWNTQELDVRKTDDKAVTFTAEIKNYSGTTQNWVISNLPTWLTVSNESGTIDPVGVQTVTFSVDAALPIGSYEAVPYLTGMMDIDEPLVIRVTSAATAPEWTVNASAYKSTMNVIGQLRTNGRLSENAEDIVAAFRGKECVGKASPEYISKFDSYYIMMNVYGNPENARDELTFKVFDAATGTVYSLVNTENPDKVSFISDEILGSYARPVIFNPEDAIEQNITLNEGYNWISIYVTPNDASLSAIFKDNTGEIDNVIANYGFSQYNGAGWSGSLAEMEVGNMYKVQATVDTQTCVIGHQADPTKVEMPINYGWNWIGYNCGNYNSLENAFADLNPTEGDIVKSQNAFSVYSDGEWIGTLRLMTPGMGYNYKSLATGATTFHYPNVTVGARSMAKARLQKAELYTNTQYAGNMTVIARVVDGENIVEDAEVSVWSGGELRGRSRQAVTDDLHFVTIAGDSDTHVLRFVISRNGKDYLLTQTMIYDNDAVEGTLTSPYLLQLGDATGIDAVFSEGVESIYDLTGRRIDTIRQKGVYIVNGQKKVK